MHAPAPIAPPSRGTIPGEENETARLIASGSGISQIKNPFGRTAATIGNDIGRIFVPGLMKDIGGTEEHHEKLINQSVGGTKLLQDRRAPDTEDALKTAQAGEAGARTQALENPPNEETPLPTEQGYVGFNRRTGEAKPITVNGQTAQPIEKPEKEPAQNVHVLPSGEVVAVSRDPATGKSKAEVVYQGDPKVKTEVKQIEVKGRPHQVLVNSDTGETIKDLGETGEKPPTINVNAGNAELDRISGRLSKPYQTAYDAGQKTLERMELTRRNVDAGYAGQGLAIPELLTSLVSGQGTGVRITQPELNAITAHRGIKGSAESFFNSLAGKGALTTEDKAQIKGVLQDAETRLQAKMKIHSDALDAINGAGSRADAVNADREARQKLNDVTASGGGNEKSFSLKQAMALPFNKGKSDADVRKDLEAHGYKVVE